MILGAGEPAQEGERRRGRKGKSDDDVLDGIHFLIRQFYTDTHTQINELQAKRDKKSSLIAKQYSIIKRKLETDPNTYIAKITRKIPLKVWRAGVLTCDNYTHIN